GLDRDEPADAAAEDRDLEVVARVFSARLDAPREYLRVEPARCVEARRPQLAPAEGPGLAGDAEAGARLRLPRAELGAERIGERTHAPGVHHVERRRDDLRAQ